jgi:hypothetical protein
MALTDLRMHAEVLHALQPKVLHALQFKKRIRGQSFACIADDSKPRHSFPEARESQEGRSIALGGPHRQQQFPTLHNPKSGRQALRAGGQPQLGR